MKDNIEVTAEKLKRSLQIGEVGLKNLLRR
jgi:hypothetical protein